MKNKNVTIEKHSGEEEKSPKIIVRCVGHEFFYPISDILRLFTGEIPRQEETCVVCDAGTMASSIDPSFSDLILLSSISEGRVETYTEKGAPGEDPWRIFIDKEDMFLPPNREVKRQLYFLLSRLSGRSFPWGSLT
ncbi:MAG: hypothetical protein J5607_00760, partial [Clostridiales bacterium]|nr:hypothetical protein [Clostridiales bacterium]